MRIAFDAKRAFNNSSGLGTYSRGLIKSLSKYFPDNKYFLFNKDNVINPYGRNVSVITPTRELDKALPSLWRSYWVSGQINQLKPHIYHGLSNEIPFGIKQIKSIVTIHDLLFLKQPQWYTGIDRIIYQSKVKYAVKNANRIIAVSNQTKNDLLHHYPFLNEDKISIIPPIIDDRFSPQKNLKEFEQIKHKFNLPDLFILSLGTIERRKNLGSVIDALQHSEHAIPLVIIGKKTSYWNEIESKLNAYKGGYLILNRLSDEEVSNIIRHAQLLINLSKDEGFGMQNIEAMRSGVPIILSDNQVFRETAGDAAIYVKHSDVRSINEAIKLLINDQNQRSDYIEKGLIHSEQFSSRVVAEKLNQIYLKLYHNGK